MRLRRFRRPLDDVQTTDRRLPVRRRLDEAARKTKLIEGFPERHFTRIEGDFTRRQLGRVPANLDCIAALFGQLRDGVDNGDVLELEMHFLRRELLAGFQLFFQPCD